MGNLVLTVSKDDFFNAVRGSTYYGEPIKDWYTTEQWNFIYDYLEEIANGMNENIELDFVAIHQQFNTAEYSKEEKEGFEYVEEYGIWIEDNVASNFRNGIFHLVGLCDDGTLVYEE